MENINKELNCSVSEEPTSEQEIAELLTYGQQKLTKLAEIKKNINWLEGFWHGLGVFRVKQGGETLYGLLNAAGEIVLEPQPKTLYIIDENTVALYNRGNNYKVLDLKNNNIYTCEHYWAQIYGGAITTRYGKKGVTDINGNFMIPHRYRDLWRHADTSYIACNRKNKCGLLDSCGKELIPFDYDCIKGYLKSHPDRFSARQGEDWFVIDRSGQRLSEKRYDYLECFTESGYAIFGKTTEDAGWPEGKRTRYGLIDKDERITIPVEFDSLCLRDDSRLSCGKTDRRNGGYPMGPSWKYGVIDIRGNMIIPPSYHHFLSQGPDRTYVADSNNEGSDYGAFQGVIDEEGRIVVPFRDWQIQSWGGVYRIYDRQTERYGLYSSSGEELLPFEFDYIYVGDTLDYIAVCKGGEWYYVNQHGERVLL